MALHWMTFALLCSSFFGTSLGKNNFSVWLCASGQLCNVWMWMWINLVNIIDTLHQCMEETVKCQTQKNDLLPKQEERTESETGSHVFMSQFYCSNWILSRHCQRWHNNLIIELNGPWEPTVTSLLGEQIALLHHFSFKLSSVTSSAESQDRMTVRSSLLGTAVYFYWPSKHGSESKMCWCRSQQLRPAQTGLSYDTLHGQKYPNMQYICA